MAALLRVRCEVFAKRGFSSAKAVCPHRFQDIPGPRSYPVVGTMHNYIPGIGEFDIERNHHACTRKMEKYGDIVKEEVRPGLNIIFMYNPADIEHLFRSENRWPERHSHKIVEYYRNVHHADRHNSAGLLPTNGQAWSQLRSSYQKAVMGRDSIRSLISKTDEIVMNLVTNVNDSKLQPASRKNFMTILMALNCELIGSSFFDATWGALDNVNNPESVTEQLSHGSTYINSNIDSTDHGFQLWKYVQTPFYRRVAKYIELLESTAEESISRLEKDESPNKAPCVAKMWLNDEKNNRKDIMTMSADMILAGIDTTAYTLGFLMYQLGRNERVQSKLFNELRSLDPQMNAPMTADLLSQATYLKRVIKETLRLNPVAVGVGRVLTDEQLFSGYHVPEQTLIVTMNQIISRLSKYYELPEEFIPERHEPAGYFKKPPPFVTLPFGHGPRACIGRRLAEQIMQIFVFRMYRQYEIIWKGRLHLDCVTRNINQPDSPLQFDFTPRAN